MPEEIDYKFTREIICPYCGYEFSDSGEFSDESKEECPECYNEFFQERIVDVSYSTEKICTCKHGAGIHYGKNDECKHQEMIKGIRKGEKFEWEKCTCTKFNPATVEVVDE